MLQHLADGEWHPVEEVMKSAYPLVPLQQAQHWYRTNLQSHHRRTGTRPGQVKAQDVHDQLRDGRRDGLRRSLNTLARKGIAEIEPKGTKIPVREKRVRITQRGVDYLEGRL